MKKFFILFALSAFLIGGSFHEKKEFAVKGRPELNLKIIAGKIEVKQWKEKRVKVNLDVEYWGKKPEVVIESRENSVFVEVKEPHGVCLFCCRKGPKANLVVFTPEGYSAHLKAVSGDIYLEGVTDRVKASSVSGDIKISRLEGNTFTASTVSGNIEGQSMKAVSSKIHSVSGDISIAEILSENINGDTVSGNISLGIGGSDLSSGEWFFKSVSGNIKVSLLEKAKPNFSIEASTISGTVKIGNEQIEGKIKKVMGNGDIKVNLKTVSGDITFNY